jgi:TolA-binding protein
MAVLFLLLAFLLLVVVAAAGIENTDSSTASLFDRSFGQLTEGQLLLLFAGLGFLIALFLFLAFGASRSRRARRRELKSRRRDAEGRVDELERENTRLSKELTDVREKLDATERTRADAIAERDRAEAAADRIRASRSADRGPAVAPVPVDTRPGDPAETGTPTVESTGAGTRAVDPAETGTRTEEPAGAGARAVDPAADTRTGATALDDRASSGDRPDAGPPQPESVTRERLDDRTAAPVAREEHVRAADEHARAAEEHARAADEEEARRR